MHELIAIAPDAVTSDPNDTSGGLTRLGDVVLITSRPGEKHREKATDSGISDYLAKPYDDSELISIVERLSNKTEVIEFP